MTAFTVKGTCTLKQGRLCHTEKFAFVVKEIDEDSAAYTAERWAEENAVLNSGFDLSYDISVDVKFSKILEISEGEILLSLPREVAPMLPGF